MSGAVHVEVRRGAYHDSVTLMQVSREVAAVEGVASAQVAMATELNLELIRGMGFETPDSGPNDLLVAVRADDDAGIAAALDRLEAVLSASGQGGSGTGLGGNGPAPRTIFSAVRRGPQAPGLALVSVPGQHAFTEALSALHAGLSVLVFSDNVPVEAEVRLKDEAAERGLLVMGPDCGTAVVSGAGLGFANAVRPGPVGIVAASGTGAQQLMCLLDGAGVGISHCLGVGGRDLSAAVGGRSTKAALALLDEDPATELVVVVSKPPDRDVAAEITSYAESLETPVQLALLGQGRPDLTSVAARAAQAVGGTWVEPRFWRPAVDGGPAGTAGRTTAGRRVLRGLFAGGTLCDEAMVLAADAVGPIRSNIPLRPEWALGPELTADTHLMIDFGDDALTQGRAHPMIDQRSRLERLALESDAPGVVLLDVVLGHGAHPDPASELAPAIEQTLRAARKAGHDLAVVVSLCAAADDPQGPDRQAEALRDAGASVHLSNAAAARAAVDLVGGAS